MYKISVIVPVYNAEQYISKTINQILVQTLKEKEIIIIDDGSTDRTLEKIKKIQKDNNNIKIISQKNSGVSIARNRGILSAKGEYILFNDADDWIENKEYLANLYREASQKKLEILVTGFNLVIDNKLKILKVNDSLNYKILEGKQFLKLSLKKKNINYHICTTLILRKKLLNKEIFFSEDISNGEDQEFLIKIFFSSSRVSYLSSLTSYCYQQIESSVTKKYNIKRIENLIKVRENIISFLEEERELNKDEKEKWIKFYSGYFYPGIFSITSKLNKSDRLKIIDLLKKENYKKLISLKQFYTYNEKIKIILAKINLELLFFLLNLKSNIRLWRKF